MAEWRLKEDGKYKTVNGHKWHWCTGKHWAEGKEVHGLYINCHEEGAHDEWQKKSEEAYQKRQAERRSKYQKHTPSNDSSTVVNDDTKKKLALSERLRTAMTTQAGLSNDAFSRIWAECENDSGKD